MSFLSPPPNNHLTDVDGYELKPFFLASPPHFLRISGCPITLSLVSFSCVIDRGVLRQWTMGSPAPVAVTRYYPLTSFPPTNKTSWDFWNTEPRIIENCNPCVYAFQITFQIIKVADVTVGQHGVHDAKDTVRLNKVWLPDSPVWLSLWHCEFCLWPSVLWWLSRMSVESEASFQSPRRSWVQSKGFCWWCYTCWCSNQR